MSSKAKWLIGVGVILVILLGFIGGTYFYANNLLNKMDKVEINEKELAVDPEVEKKYGEIKNIAIFGIDAEEGERGRSDAIMILTLDSINNKTKITSIIRDSYVDIAGYGKDKINHAYAFGGPELAIRTLNENFNLNIKDFMAVNFTSLPIIVDKIGGIEVDITEEEIPHLPEIKTPGRYNLTGEQALAYARIRYASGGDFKRSERQRTVLNAIFNKLKDATVTEYASLVGEFLPYVKTNMATTEIFGLGKDFMGIKTSELQQERFPKDEQGTGEMINGIYYYTFDKNVVRDSLHKYIFEDKQ